MQARTEVLSTIPSVIGFIEKLPEYDKAIYVHKKSKTTEENSLESLKAVLPVLEQLTVWEEQSLHDSMMKLVEEMGVKNSLLLWPLRIAISGKEVTPGGAIEIADILGKEETLERIRQGIVKLSV